MRYLLLLLIPFIPTFVYSQYTVIALDLSSAITNKFHVSIEHSLNKNLTVGFNYQRGVYSEGTTGNLNSQTKIYELTGWTIMPEVRLYPFNKKKIAPRGFSLGLYYRVGSFQETYTGQDYSQLQSGPIPSNQPSNVNVKTNGSTNNFGILWYSPSLGHV